MYADDEFFLPDGVTRFGIPLRCCATRGSHRKIYASKVVSKGLETDADLAEAPVGPALEFSQAQEHWRNV